MVFLRSFLNSLKPLLTASELAEACTVVENFAAKDVHGVAAKESERLYYVQLNGALPLASCFRHLIVVLCRVLVYRRCCWNEPLCDATGSSRGGCNMAIWHPVIR